MSMGWNYVSKWRLPTSLLLISQMTYKYGIPMEWYLERKTKELVEKPVPLPLCISQIPHKLIRALTWAKLFTSYYNFQKKMTWLCGLVKGLFGSVTFSTIKYLPLTCSNTFSWHRILHCWHCIQLPLKLDIPSRFTSKVNPYSSHGRLPLHGWLWYPE